MSEIDSILGSAPDHDPSGASLKPKTSAAAAKPPSEIDGVLDSAPATDRGLSGWARDIGTTALKGAISVPEAVVGLADIPTGGRVGKFLQDTVGFDPKAAREVLTDWSSDANKEAQRKFQEADGVWGKTKAAIENPSLIATGVGESLPSMLAGGVIGRGILAAAPRLAAMGAPGAAIAAGAGEGATMAGSAAEQIRQETDDGLLNAKQAGLAAATGVVGGAVGALGGRLANRLGIGDAETMLAQGQKGMAAQFAAKAASNGLTEQAVKGIPRRVIEGAIAEGFLEELPQSVAEQIFQNLALDKPWYEDVDSNAVMGVLTGGAMGGGASGYHAFAEGRYRAANQAPATQPEEVTQSAGAAAFSAGQPRTPPAELVSVADKAKFVRDWDSAAAQSFTLAPEPGESMGPAGLDGVNVGGEELTPGDAVAGMTTSPGASPEQFDQGLDMPGTDFDTDGLSLEQGPGWPRLALPAPAITVDSGGTARTTADRNADLSTPLPTTGSTLQTPSQAMGLDPSVGPLSAGAALAVDSGASAHMAQAARQAEQVAAVEKAQRATPAAGRKPDVDRSTGEILGGQMADWTDADLSTAFRAAQGKSVRLQLAQELSRRRAAREAAGQAPASATSLQPVAATPGDPNGATPNQAKQTRAKQAQGTRAQTDPAKSQAPKSVGEPDRITTAGVAWTRMTTADRYALAQRIRGVKPVIQRNLPGAQWANLNGDVQRKLADVMTPATAAVDNPARSVDKAATAVDASAAPADKPVSAIDAAAHQAATSEQNELPAPTEAQKEAGNYKKGHAKINGLDISIENPAGSRRRPEWPALQDHYGYVRGSIGKDKDHVDVFMTDRAEDTTLPVFVVDQNRANGSFDEHKVIMGAATEAEARETYLRNYSKGWTGLGGITQMSQDEFKAWVRDPAQTKKRVANNAVALAAAPAAVNDSLTTARKPKTVPEKMREAKAKQKQRDQGGEQPLFSRTQDAGNAFLPAPDGGFDFGEITAEMGKAMRRQAGKIRLQQGVQNSDGTGWGLAHIEANHGKQIRNAGFASVPDFVAHIASGFNEVLQASKGRQLLVAVTNGRRDVMFVQLEIAEAGDFYRVNTAFPASRNYLEKQEGKGATILWNGSEPRSTATGQRSPYAGDPEISTGQDAPIARVEKLEGDGSEPASAATGRQPAYATAANASPESLSSQGSSNARGQAPSVSPRDPDAKLRREATAAALSPEEAAALVDAEWPVLNNGRVAEVQAQVDRLTAGWANKPDVVVVQSLTDPAVPQRVRDYERGQLSQGAQGQTEGFFYRGKVYLVAGQLKSDAAVQRVLVHESLGHYGLQSVFGDALRPMLRELAQARRSEVEAKAAQYALDLKNPRQLEIAAEEVLAEMAEKRPNIGLVRRAVAAVRTWLRKNMPGFQSWKVSDDEIVRTYLLPARGFVERGELSGGKSRGDGVFSSRSAEQEPKMTLDAVQQALTAALRGIPDAPDVKVVADPFAAGIDVPAGVVPMGGVGGDGVIYLFANNIPSVLEVHKTLFHELYHRGSKVQFDSNPQYVQKMLRLAADDPIVQREANDWRESADGRAKWEDFSQRGRMTGERLANYQALAVEEGLATLAESVMTGNIVQRRTVMGKISGFLHKLAKAWGMNRLADWIAKASATQTEQFIRDTVMQSGGAVNARSTALLFRQATDDQPDPRFSRSMADLKASALDQLQKTFTHEGKVSVWDKTVGTMRNLAERSPAFKPVFEGAQRFIDDVSTLANDAADFAPRLMPRVESLGDIFGKNRRKPVSAADNTALSAPLFQGTLSWARDVDGKPAMVDALAKKYADLPADDKAQLMLRAGRLDEGVLRMWRGLPKDQYEKLIESRFEGKMLKAGVVWSDEELSKQFGLNDQQISLYREARQGIDRSIDVTARADMLRALGDDYADLRDQVLGMDDLKTVRDFLVDRLSADAKADPDKADRLMQLNHAVVDRYEKATELQAQGYAPLSRFGRYSVDVVDASGERQYFGMFESMRESNAMKAKMEREFPGATVTQGTMSQETYKLFAGITPESLELFGNMLGLSEQGDDARDKAFQTYLQLTKNNHSALKRLIHRKGISGFSEDVGRVMASFVYSNARQAAGALNAGAMDKAISEIPKEQGELKDVAMGLRNYIRDPQEEGQAVRGMLFAQYLGGSVASALVNMAQPFQITTPYLSQYGGMAKASKQMAKAVKDMASRKPAVMKYGPELAAALKAAEDDGTVSPQEIHQLMAQARGAGTLRSGDGTRAGNLRAGASNKWEQTKVLWGQPFAIAEQFNRRSTFIAAYRTAKDQGIADPGAFARKAVLETQFLYSKANKPRWARGAIGGTLFTFKTYSVSYMELMHRMWNQGGPEGKRAVGWSLAMLMLLGGAGGLPFMEDAEDLIDGGAQLMGYNISSKQWRQEFLSDVLGKELADFIETGVSGLPGAPIDVSGRLGMGNLIPGTGLALDKQNRERDLLEVVGPAGDLIARGFTGARKLLTGDVGGAALEVAPSAVRNAAKGVDMAASGMYKDTKGYKVMDTTLAEAAAKFIGFQPRTVSEDGEATAFKRRAMSFYTQNSSEIKAQWADALFRNDESALERVRDRLAAWNRNNPDQPIVVKMTDVWKKVREMGKDRGQRIAEAAPKAIRRLLRQELSSNP